MSYLTVQQQDKMVFHIHYWSTALYELAPLLLIIFTHSPSSGVVSPSFELAAITPVFKSGDRTAPNNHHPISLTNFCNQ